MKKTVFFLTGDYWHPTKSISPLIPLLFLEDTWQVMAMERPKELLRLSSRPDLIITFKDPDENDQNPGPTWCDDPWSQTVIRWVKEGMGLIVMHAALTDLPMDHPFVQALTHGVFIKHPPQCPVTFIPTVKHPITEGVDPFTFPENDEHYMMNLAADAEGEVIGITKSQHGTQPGLWAHTYGKGHVCCITPGHTTANLTCPGYVQLLSNAVSWCVSTDS